MRKLAYFAKKGRGVTNKSLRFSHSNSQPIVSMNPTTGEMMKQFPFDSSSVIDKALHDSFKAFDVFKRTTLNERCQIVLNIAQDLQKNKERYAKMMTMEMGKTIKSAVQEVEKCEALCRYYANESEKILEDEVVKSDASKTKVIYQPLGPILQIPPFNFPFWQVFRFAIPALIAGNVVMIRHSHSVPQCALLIHEVFENNVPIPHVSINLFADNPSVKRMIEDSRVRGVSFTGSTQTGRIIAEYSGRNLKKHVLELGGSDPFIVLRDANLQLAIQNAVQSRIMNCGQSCIAPKRMIIEESVLDEFTEGLLVEFRKLKVGDPMETDTSVGPMARQDLRDKLASQVKQSVEQGARVVFGGSIPHERLDQRIKSGYFYSPTILTNVKPGMVAEREELFGPVATIIPCKNEMDAVQIANNSEYGLGGSVFTEDKEKGEMVARSLECGLAFVNGMVKSAPQYPFGGVKDSGYGRECGEIGIKEWCNIKSLWIK